MSVHLCTLFPPHLPRVKHGVVEFDIAREAIQIIIYQEKTMSKRGHFFCHTFSSRLGHRFQQDKKKVMVEGRSPYFFPEFQLTNQCMHEQKTLK